MSYTPRRFSKRWSEGAPDYVLDCFDDDRTADRYTVLFCKHLCFHVGDGTYIEGPGEFWNTRVRYLGMSAYPSHPQGVSQWGEMAAIEAMGYRRSNSHRRVRWLDLPENIRQHVVARAKS